MNAQTDHSSPLRVSVVIPTFGEPENVRRAVQSVLAQDLSPDQYETIVVDSSPDDRVVRTVEALQPGARCALRVLTKPAEGPGPSRNLGVRTARGEIIALMDSDCDATPGWLRFGLAAFDEGALPLVLGGEFPYGSSMMSGLFPKAVLKIIENEFKAGLSPVIFLHPYEIVSPAGWPKRFARDMLSNPLLYPFTINKLSFLNDLLKSFPISTMENYINEIAQ